MLDILIYLIKIMHQHEMHTKPSRSRDIGNRQKYSHCGSFILLWIFYVGFDHMLQRVDVLAIRCQAPDYTLVVFIQLYSLYRSG